MNKNVQKNLPKLGEKGRVCGGRGSGEEREIL